MNFKISPRTFNKKADISLGAIILVIIIVVFLGWLINEGSKDCRADADCEKTQYCGADFACHDHKVIREEKASPLIANNAAWVIGLSLIIAALIFKWDSIFHWARKDKKNKSKNKEEYIDLSKSHKAEEKGLYEKELEK
ncbi:hypothetical protein GF323_05470 [Candidatus Woesearchaeota archaeon]|nr:hypothetical protein [Candidatus Woesearchaeota archaeon]